MSVTAVKAALTSPLVSAALKVVLPLVHDVLGGGVTADKIVGRIKLKALDIDGEQIAAQQQILKAELEGSWLQRNWRPIAMLVFVFLVFFQLCIIPIANAIWGTGTLVFNESVTLKIIGLIQIAVTGYIGGRSIEKSIKTYVENKPLREVTKEPDDGLKPRAVPSQATVETPPFMRPDVE